ncbi:hypothetical protein AV530_015575 [Patagioenas fasciata monilis]|uniref:Uncharacterized protein n=1 Tax=Patagioenas fasciata monilis TaxID=372326 RepID=A0A1V4KI48_PATFA|nr:hypothetical protein AV530_015575 [Patagioenas fasciata monilis]
MIRNNVFLEFDMNRNLSVTDYLCIMKTKSQESLKELGCLATLPTGAIKANPNALFCNNSDTEDIITTDRPKLSIMKHFLIIFTVKSINTWVLYGDLSLSLSPGAAKPGPYRFLDSLQHLQSDSCLLLLCAQMVGEFAATKENASGETFRTLNLLEPAFNV